MLIRHFLLQNECFVFSKDFFVSSPAPKLTVVVDGGFVKIDIMSIAACLKKSVLTAGNGTTVGKKVTVSTSLSDLVCGKQQFTHL